MCDFQYPGEHVYEGMYFLGEVSAESIDKVRNMTFVDGDILIASYPKTGTSWMQEVSWVVNKEGDLTEALAEPLNQRMLFLEYGDEMTDFKSGIDILADRPRPAIIKTHLPANLLDNVVQSDKLKIVVMIRNPKDTLVSFYHFSRSASVLGRFAGSWDDFYELYKAKRLAYGDYFDWYRSWIPYLKKPNVQLYAYEDMKADLGSTVRRLSGFFEKSVSEDKVATIVKHATFDTMKTNKMANFADLHFLKNDIAPFMRKGAVGDWRNYFTDAQSRYVDEEYKEKLEKLGLVVKFDQ